MKTILVNSLTVMLMFVSTLSFAQSNKLSTSRMISLNENSKAQDIIVEVSGDVKQLRIDVKCTINYGSIVMEIISPDGEPQGKFAAGDPNSKAPSSDDLLDKSSSIQESGMLEKFVENPENGIWIIRMVPKNVKGEVRVSTAQYFKE